jgi:hypothetical protein
LLDYLALDEIARLFPYSNLVIDFCGLLRTWHEEAKKNREIWRKQRLVVIHSTKLYIPLSANKSPFNLGLRPFNSDQVQDWAKRQGQDWSGEDAQQLTGFVNRNTYLVRVALYHIGRGDVTLEQVLHNSPIWPEFMAIAYNDNCGTYNSSQSCWQHSCEC